MREREADGRKKKKVEKWRRYEQGESTRSKVVTEDDDEDKSGNGDEKCETDEVEDEVWIGRCVVVVFGEGWGGMGMEGEGKGAAPAWAQWGDDHGVGSEGVCLQFGKVRRHCLPCNISI